MAHPQRDNGSLHDLVMGAIPDPPAPSFHADTSVVVDYLHIPTILAELCSSVSVICTAKVVGILRQAHSPENSTRPDQHTVYLLAVDQYLKDDGRGKPAVLKVWQTGGPLPFKFDYGFGVKGKGVGYRSRYDPMIEVGSRYCLFLSAADPQGVFSDLGYIPGVWNHIIGKVMELDEYRVTDVYHGKLLLKNGMSLVNPGTESMPKDFFPDARIVNVPESQALQLIRAEVARQTPPPVDMTPPLPEVIYIPDRARNLIREFCVKTSGQLRPLAEPFIPSLGDPVCIQFRPDGRFGFAANIDSNILMGYKLGTDSLLRQIGPPFQRGAQPVWLALHPSGKALYVLNAGDNTLLQMYITADGQTKPLSPPTVATGKGPTSVSIEPSGHFAYITNGDDNTISQFQINSDGTLAPLTAPTIKTPSSPTHLLFEPSGHFAYLIQLKGPAMQYRVGSGGLLEPLTPAVVDGATQANWISFTKDHAYISTDHSVKIYHIQKDGSLHAESEAKITAGSLDPSLLTLGPSVVDISGQFFYVLGRVEQKGLDAFQFRLEKDGSLSPLAPALTEIESMPPISTTTGVSPPLQMSFSIAQSKLSVSPPERDPRQTYVLGPYN